MNDVFDLTVFENKIAIINEIGEHFYYGDLMTACGKLQPFFCPGDEEKKLVAVLAKNNIETLIGYLAGVQNNHSVMFIDANLDKALIDNLIKIYNPDFTWGPGKNDNTALFKYKDYELIHYDWDNKPTLYPSLSLLLSTSGSTGSPKLVSLTKDNILANARSIALYLHLDDTERPITNLPIHYSYGLSVINSHLLVGSTILLTDMPIVKKEFWDFFKSHEGTSLTGIPYTYEILKRIGFPKMNLKSLRYMTQAGGKLGTGLILEYARLSREKNFDFYVMYGATEATARISYLSPQHNILKAGSIGKTIPDGKMQLIDESGNTITQPNLEGELVYQGPNVMMGYAHCRQDLSQNDRLAGILKTGDIAYFDEDGFYYITGRKNRFLKILGKRISLAEIEEFLKNLRYNCVCGGEDDRLLIACHPEEIVEKIRKDVFSRFKVPLDLIGIFQIKNIPRNSVGKINYKEIFSQKLNPQG